MAGLACQAPTPWQVTVIRGSETAPERMSGAVDAGRAVGTAINRELIAKEVPFTFLKKSHFSPRAGDPTSQSRTFLMKGLGLNETPEGYADFAFDCCWHGS